MLGDTRPPEVPESYIHQACIGAVAVCDGKTSHLIRNHRQIPVCPKVFSAPPQAFFQTLAVIEFTLKKSQKYKFVYKFR
jgi:hypothetical protein